MPKFAIDGLYQIHLIRYKKIRSLLDISRKEGIGMEGIGNRYGEGKN